MARLDERPNKGSECNHLWFRQLRNRSASKKAFVVPNDSATVFANRISTLPTAHQATHCVQRDIRRFRQFFVSYAEFNPSRDSLTNAVGISQEDIGKLSLVFWKVSAL